MPNYDRTTLTRKIQSLTDLSADERSALLELLNTRKKYGLVWEDKPEKVEDDLRTQFPVLVEVVDRRIVGPEGSPNHVLIEGDNLHALTSLQYTHQGKVDVIFIDPPYNTGNKDFVYNDHFVDKEDQWRHSKWLSFMEKRLKLAKSLLKETGVIFISIDDNEVGQLRILANEVFGEDEFIATVIWQKRYSRENREAIGDVHDFILVYAKDPEDFKNRRNKVPLDEKQASVYKNPDNPNETDPKKRWQSVTFTAQGYRVNQMYEIIAPNGKVHRPPEGRCWGATEPEYKRLLAEGRITFGPNGNGVPRVVRYLSEVDGLVPWTWWPHEEVGHTDEARKEIQSIFGTQTAFDTPKPVRLIDRILKIASSKSSVVLDFFAGSGTTLHATMALNAEDGGSRQCILVTNNENKICEEVTYERNRRVIQGYTNAKGIVVAGLVGNSLRYYRTTFVGRERTQKNRRDLTRASVDLLCLKESSYAERSDMMSAERRVFEGPEHLLFVLFDPDVIPETVELIAGASKPCKIYVFSPGAYAWDDEFEEVKDKITLCALPEALVQAFQKVMPAEGEPARYDPRADDEIEVAE